MSKFNDVDPGAQPGFTPLVCADLELADPVLPASVPTGHGIRYLVRLHGEPLGCLTIGPYSVVEPVEDHVGRAWDALSDAILQHLHADGLTADPHAVAGLGALRPSCTRRWRSSGDLPEVAVVVPTVGSHPVLRDCVDALLGQDYEGSFEVIVVDNRPESGNVARALEGVDDPRLRIVDEPIAGASRARNAGLAASAAPIVAFTDDDAVADGRWLASSVAALEADPRIAATTGLVIAGSLQTDAELWFEENVGFSKGFRRLIWGLEDEPALPGLGSTGRHGRLFPFRASVFGSGNSMCFRRQVLIGVGGFDTRLGPGTPALGGEDLDAFVKILLDGYLLVYEPRAFVRHFHRSTMPELERQMHQYGVGLTAYMAHEAICHPWEVLRSMRRSGSMASRPTAKASAYSSLSERIWRLNRSGLAKGPVAYARSRVASIREQGAGTGLWGRRGGSGRPPR